MSNLKQIESGLIPVYESEKGSRLVNMRELHTFLEVETRFNDWIGRRIEQYGFTENEDYVLLKSEYGGNTTFQPKEYIFKLEPAKEIAMVENNEKGKQIRKYFITVEEKFKQQAPLSQIQILQNAINVLAEQEKVITETKAIAIEAKTGLEQAREVISNIKDTILNLPVDKWREWVNQTFTACLKSEKCLGNHESIRNESYSLLERKSRADLATRVRNKKKRLTNAGATKTAINNYCKLDAIEEGKQLKEIYTGIIKEFRIKYIA